MFNTRATSNGHLAYRAFIEYNNKFGNKGPKQDEWATFSSFKKKRWEYIAQEVLEYGNYANAGAILND